MIRAHSIEVDAYSELGGENRAHFNLYINDSLIADFFAEKRKKKYRIKWEGYLRDIDSIMFSSPMTQWEISEIGIYMLKRLLLIIKLRSRI